MMDDEKLLNVSVVFQTEFFIIKNIMLIHLHEIFLYSNVILIFDRINFWFVIFQYNLIQNHNVKQRFSINKEN